MYKIIKKKRLEKNLTIPQLSDLAGLSQSYISDLENGRIRKPCPELLRQLVKPLDLTLPD